MSSLASRIRRLLTTPAQSLASCIILVFVASSPASPVQIRKRAPLSAAARVRVRRAAEAVGLILVRNRGDAAAPRPRGSCVVVRSDGILVTNGHVISEGRSNHVFDELYLALGDAAASAGKPEYRLEPVLIDREHDLALLRILPMIGVASRKPPSDEKSGRMPSFPIVELETSHAVRLLDDLVIIGYPEKGGAGVTLNAGIVEGRDVLGNWIKTDARVIHGNSGGAAVNSDGKLIGIPTKVEADNQEIDTDGDGFPDSKRTYGAVGFLRPASLVAELLARLEDDKSRTARPPAPAPAAGSPAAPLIVRGIVKSLSTGKPLAGALVGLVPLGTERVSEETLLAWGTANAEGEFRLNRPVPQGTYTLKAKALGHAPYSRDIEIRAGAGELIIELRAPSDSGANQ